MSIADLHIIEGGVGKHLQFTALLDALTVENKLCLNSGYPELFILDKRVASSTTYILQPILDTTHKLFSNYNNIICKDPYKTNFLKGDRHIIDYWAEMYNIENVEKIPNFVINEQREIFLQKEILKLGKFILVQFTGGQGVMVEDYNISNSGRNYHDGQELINLIKEALPDINIVVFGHSNEPAPLLNTTQSIFIDKLDFMILAKYCLSFISIDSCLQHICSNKSFNKKGIVLWGSSKANMFGYDKNINLVSEYPYCVEIKPKNIVDKFLHLELDD
jgi:hypothetical protein|tara:strand:- start:1787 stop:2614 length:828 start_codon:yes stop_codon:yes gene_type:complete